MNTVNIHEIVQTVSSHEIATRRCGIFLLMVAATSADLSRPPPILVAKAPGAIALTVMLTGLRITPAHYYSSTLRGLSARS
jgi:hypothetical protein